MVENLKEYIDCITRIIEAIGVLTIFTGVVYSLFYFFISIVKKTSNRFITLRQKLGKSILLGLEILIAGDIISTVSTEPTLSSISVLGFIVLIRTFLSMSLQIELEGKLPWHKETTILHKLKV